VATSSSSAGSWIVYMCDPIVCKVVLAHSVNRGNVDAVCEGFVNCFSWVHGVEGIGNVYEVFWVLFNGHVALIETQIDV
jgi:hypothetical protein